MFNKQEQYYTVLFYVIRGVRLGQPTRQPVDDHTAAETTAIPTPYVRIRVKKIEDRSKQRINE